MHDELSTIDLNADLGESYGRWSLGDDDATLDLVSSANVACGFHAGDPATLLRTVRAAAERGVTIGAHVGYPDLAGFGRRFIDMAPGDLTAAVLYQIGALDGLCRAAGTSVAYVKPHGALYHSVVKHEGQAAAVIAAVVEYSAPASSRRTATYDASLAVLGLPGSALLRRATEAGLTAIPEAFVDRGYTPEGALVPRDQSGALLDDAEVVAHRAVQMVRKRTVAAVDGTSVTVEARSLCVHGDSPGATQMARAIRQALAEAGIDVRSFVEGPAR
ncbi:MAG: 5-oxoprolinase subunit PxpA [Nakamurella sp.]